MQRKCLQKATGTVPGTGTIYTGTVNTGEEYKKPEIYRSRNLDPDRAVWLGIL
jgi:hypothetical protein